jgi:hypothetical protein
MRPAMDIELESFLPSSSTHPVDISEDDVAHLHDSEPLLPSSADRKRLIEEAEYSLSSVAFDWLFHQLPPSWRSRYTDIMMKSKLSQLSRKLQTASEPGLTNAQLMLTNFDLKPVEPERRQWGK